MRVRIKTEAQLRASGWSSYEGGGWNPPSFADNQSIVSDMSGILGTEIEVSPYVKGNFRWGMWVISPGMIVDKPTPRVLLPEFL